MKLGKIIKVDLREVWPHEANDFTQWLAKPESLDMLGNEIGLDIELIQTEFNVGGFRADILAQEKITGKKIVIENQLETTDHSHLGQILTYAAGIGAEYLIWIAKDIRDEHKQVVDFLNEHTDEQLNFFLIRIEALKIDESVPAARFSIISYPNDWTKSVRGNTRTQMKLTDTGKKYLEFWQKFRDYGDIKEPSLNCRIATGKNYYNLASGISDVEVAFTLSPRDEDENIIACELYFKNSKSFYEKLYSNKDEVEKILGTPLSWQPLPEKIGSRIRITREFDFKNLNNEYLENVFDWLIQMSLKFKHVVLKYKD